MLKYKRWKKRRKKRWRNLTTSALSVLCVNSGELIIKKGDCQCKCVPFTFKISKNDKSLSIDKTKDGDINVETDIHNIQFKWGRGITPTEDDTTLETVKCIADK